MGSMTDHPLVGVVNLVANPRPIFFRTRIIDEHWRRCLRRRGGSETELFVQVIAPQGQHHHRGILHFTSGGGYRWNGPWDPRETWGDDVEWVEGSVPDSRWPSSPVYVGHVHTHLQGDTDLPWIHWDGASPLAHAAAPRKFRMDPTALHVILVPIGALAVPTRSFADLEAWLNATLFQQGRASVVEVHLELYDAGLVPPGPMDHNDDARVATYLSSVTIHWLSTAAVSVYVARPVTAGRQRVELDADVRPWVPVFTDFVRHDLRAPERARTSATCAVACRSPTTASLPFEAVAATVAQLCGVRIVSWTPGQARTLPRMVAHLAHVLESGVLNCTTTRVVVPFSYTLNVDGGASSYGHIMLLVWEGDTLSLFDPNGGELPAYRDASRHATYVGLTSYWLVEHAVGWGRGLQRGGHRVTYAAPTATLPYQTHFEPRGVAGRPGGCCTMVVWLVYLCLWRFQLTDPHRVAHGLTKLFGFGVSDEARDALWCGLLAWQNELHALALDTHKLQTQWCAEDGGGTCPVLLDLHWLGQRAAAGRPAPSGTDHHRRMVLDDLGRRLRGCLGLTHNPACCDRPRSCGVWMAETGSVCGREPATATDCLCAAHNQSLLGFDATDY